MQHRYFLRRAGVRWGWGTITLACFWLTVGAGASYSRAHCDTSERESLPLTSFRRNTKPARIDSIMAGVPPSSRASTSDKYLCLSLITCRMNSIACRSITPQPRERAGLAQRGLRWPVALALLQLVRVRTGVCERQEDGVSPVEGVVFDAVINNFSAEFCCRHSNSTFFL